MSLRTYTISLVLMLVIGHSVSVAQTLTGTDAMGNFNQYDDQGRSNNTFNPNRTDSSKVKKEVPKGIYVWTVDRKLGDITPATVDTLPHLYPHSTMASGINGDYNTLGSNYTARLSRIFIDREENQQFLFTQPYSQITRNPDQIHFTNTLSPITNLSYDNCGDKNDGEDHLEAKFAVNAGKRIGMGFDINYAYARGYFQNQSNSYFGATFYTSYLGDHYQLHASISTNNQKATENGGITNDNYITHPELFSESFSTNEIPTVLSSNWNRNHWNQIFLTHRYNLGFYRKVAMTEDEIKAKQFAMASQKQHKTQVKMKENGVDAPKGKEEKDEAPKGRPDGARIVGAEPTRPPLDSLATDTTRIKIDSKAAADSLLALEKLKDSLEAFTKKEFVPVTSFIHTLEYANYERIYQAYKTPSSYYGNTYYNLGPDAYPGDSIYDLTKHTLIKNTLGLALLEGFNKWAQAGLKGFVTHELRHFDMMQFDDAKNPYMERWTEHNVSIGGRLSKTQGRTLHYSLMAETWLIGEDAGQLKIDFSTDLNFELFGDTVRLAAKAYMHRLNPTFYERHFHSKHLWWDNNLNSITRTRAEGLFSYEKTNTTLRVAIEEMQNYTYLSMSYDATTNGRTNLTATLNQNVGNINVLTAQVDQKFTLGPLHWDNIVTFQSSSNKEVLPLPTLNIFSNLYLDFMIAKVLKVELGGAITYFTEYKAPDFCPQFNQYAIQTNADSRVTIGNFPFIDVYANLHLKHARFFVMMSNATATSFNRNTFLTPHYPQNNAILRMGVSWNFFN